MENAKRRPITRFPANLGNNRGWKNLKSSTWSRNSYWSGTYSWATWNFQGRIIDATNATFEEAKTALKRIVGPHAKNEHWNVVCMKEEFHARFATILQIIYQRKRLVYFNNQIVITIDLANRGQLVNWCSIMLTQLLVELIGWTEH